VLLPQNFTNAQNLVLLSQNLVLLPQNFTNAPRLLLAVITLCQNYSKQEIQAHAIIKYIMNM
jgi:hypothetical protein